LNLKINAEKSTIAPPRLSYLGMIIAPDGVRVDPERIKSLKDLPSPKNKDTLRSFLGLANYYRPFIRKFDWLAAPLWALLKKKALFIWNSTTEEAFLKIKQAIIKATCLVHVDPTLQLVLRVDASNLGIGGVLAQLRPTGKLDQNGVPVY